MIKCTQNRTSNMDQNRFGWFTETIVRSCKPMHQFLLLSHESDEFEI